MTGRTRRATVTGAVLPAAVAAGAVLLLAAACGGSAAPSGAASMPASSARVSSAAGPTAPEPAGPATSAAGVPAFQHIVVVVMENHAYGEIIGNPAAPFLNGLARNAALFTRSFAVGHPSEPNYLELFSGSAHGITDDSCPHTLAAPSLGADLVAAGKTFTGYAEGLPSTGSPVCASNGYARKHAPWTDFPAVPPADSRPFSAFPRSRLAALPTVAWVIPDLCHDMHDCDVATGDAWLRQHIGGYARWAVSHRSLLIVTWDEDDSSTANHIVTLFAGQFVRPGRYDQPITHYNVLATIEAAYGLPRDGQAAHAAPIAGIWLGN